jgi:hypothetical protein
MLYFAINVTPKFVVVLAINRPQRSRDWALSAPAGHRIFHFRERAAMLGGPAARDLKKRRGDNRPRPERRQVFQVFCDAECNAFAALQIAQAKITNP